MHARALLSPVLCAAAIGCSGGVDHPDPSVGEDSAAGGRYGLVVLTHEDQAPGIEVSGQLMAFEGQRRAAALHTLTVPEQAWLTDVAPARGACVELASESPEAGAWIDLLGAGELTVLPPEPLDDGLTLAPSAFPPMLFAVSGVVYDAAAPQDLPYLAGGTYRVLAPGDEVGELQAEVRAPGPVQVIETTRDDAGLWVRWAGEPQARVMVVREEGSRAVGVSCGAADGEALVPAARLRGLEGDAVLVVAAVSRTSTSVEGLEETDVVFVSRDTVELQLSR